MKRVYDKSGLPSGANASKQGLALLAVLACVPFLYLAFVDKGVYLDQTSKQAYKGPRALAFVPVDQEAVAKSNMRIYVKNESAPAIDSESDISYGLCWFDIVDGHGRKKGGERAECDR